MQLISIVLAASAIGFVAGAPLKEKRAGKLQFFGVNESGPEFGNANLPGTKNKDYVWPTFSTIDQFIAKGMNTFRINFQMERLIANKMTGSLDSAYQADLLATVNYITQKGAYAMIVPHNYGRYYNSIITDVSGFKAYWTTVAKAYAGNSKVIFDTNNEYHDMDQSLVVQLNQAAIDGIRAAGATSQYITVEGNNWTGAWSWTSSQNGATMGSLKDPQNRLIYQMHQYLDSDYSGTHDACQSATIGVDSIKAATQWLKDNKKQGIIGEFAGGNNDQCKTAIKGMLQHLDDNADVWKGALWWAAGPWWADYIYSMEPTSGVSWSAYVDLIAQYK